MSDFSSILGAIWAPISVNFRDHFRDNPFLQKTHGAAAGAPFSRFHPPKNNSFWDPVSSTFSNLFSTPLRNTILEPPMPIWSQKAGFWDPLWIPLGPKMGPKAPQERPKPCTKPSREGPQSAQGHFGSRRAFGGPILDPFGTLWGSIHNAARSPPTLFIYSARDSDRACTFRFRSSLLTPLWGAYRRPTKGPFGGRAPLGGGPP